MVAFDYVKLSLCDLNYLEVYHFPMDYLQIINVFNPSLVCINVCTSITYFVSSPVSMASVHYCLLNFNCTPSTVPCMFYTLPPLFS